MTTPSTSRKAGPLLGTGSQTTWPFTFKVFAATDIAVTIADSLGGETALVYGVDYNVTLNANQETSPGGTVTYPIAGSPLPVGTRLVIIGNLPYDQPLDLPSGGNFSPLALENQLDRTVMQVQQLRENVGRALQLPVTAAGTLSVQLPPPTANQLIGWDAGGSNLANIPLSSIATALAFATYRFDTFTGDGVETQFTLSTDPATLGNLDIAVGGVTQTPGADYTLLSGVLVFSSAPPLGAVILARYGEGLPPGAIGNALDVAYTPAGLGAVVRTAESKLRETVSVKDFGAVGDGVTDDTAAFQAAIQALRKNPRTILAYIGGPTITAYESGQLYVPTGVYNLQFDVFDITQDIGLTFIGAGSRGKTNYIRGNSVLRFTGTSSGFGFRFAFNGGRNGAFQDIDVTYLGNTFTGHLVEVTGAQGFFASGCYFGTDGDSGATRFTSATSLFRPTYDEFFTLENCVLNGAQYGWYDDATITISGNTFGGSASRIQNCTFYDFAVSHMYSSPSRSRLGVVIVGNKFNPITVSSIDTVDLNNVTGVLLDGCTFAPSTASTVPAQWLKTNNVTGVIDACTFGDLCPAGTLNGNLSLTGNFIFSSAGFTLVGGIIRGSSNEFGKSTYGFLMSPTAPLSFDLGPDEFKPTNVSYSYDIPADNVFLNGKINYSSQQDNSVNKFRNVSNRVTVASFAENSFSVATTPYQILATDTGRLIVATSTTSAQTFTLPAAQNGISFKIFHGSDQDLTIQRSGSNRLLDGTGTTFTSVTIPGTVGGGYIELQGYGTVGWIVKSVVGNWTFA